MAEANRDHYRNLGVTRNAKPEEIRRAYERIRTQMREEATPPDPRRVVLLQDAYDTLSDEARRAAYDASLREPAPKASIRRGPRIAAAVGIAAALGIAGLLWRGHGDGPPPPSETETLSAASVAVGRVHAIDLAGHVTPLGLAFAVAQGRLMMACAPIAAGSEIVVRIGSRDVPARSAGPAEGDALCALDAPQAGSWPLTLASAAPVEGAEVHAVRVSGSGEVTLMPGRVSRIERRASGAVLELSGDAAGEERGGPVFDARGHVVAIAMGEGRFATIPSGASAAPAVRPTKGR